MSAPEKPPSSPPASPRRSRWLDRSSLLLLLVAVGVVIAVVAPLLPRSQPADQALVAPTASASETAPSPSSPRAVSASDRPPRFDPDDKPRLTELERMYPDGMWPGHASQDRPQTPTANPIKGRTTKPVVLRETPDAASGELGRVAAGETVLVIRERAGWAFVVHRGPTDLHTGWVPRADVAVP